MAEDEKDTGEGTDPSEVARQWFGTDEGRAWLQPQLDRTIAKALKTHDEKRAPEIEKAISAAREDGRKEGSMTEAEKRDADVRRLQEELSGLKGELSRKDRDAQLLQYAEEMKVPRKAIADVLANPAATVESGRASIDGIAETLEQIRKDAANQTLINDSHKPGSGSPGENNNALPFDPNDMSAENRRKAEAYYAAQLGEGAAS
jgi:hypothetical protein